MNISSIPLLFLNSPGSKKLFMDCKYLSKISIQSLVSFEVLFFNRLSKVAIDSVNSS